MLAASLKQQANFKRKDYLLVFLVLLTTVNPFWKGNKYVQLLVFLVIFYHSFKTHKKIVLDEKIIVLFSVFTIICAVQGIFWGFSLFTLFSSFTLTYFYTYYLFNIYKSDLFILLEKVLWNFTLLSLIIFFLHELIPPFANLLSALIDALEPFSSDVERYSRSLMFYTYRPKLVTDYGIIRNSGFAHEPGAFAVFTTFAITINFLRGIPLNSKRNIVYYIATFTTFSTAGYLALFILFLLLIKNRKYKFLSIIMLLILLPLSLKYFVESPFMQEKIEGQIEEQTQQSLNEKTTGRIYGMRKSLYVLQLYPAHGRGLQSQTMPSSSLSPEYASYGWISYISKLGIFLGALFLFYYLRGIYNLVSLAGYDTFSFFVISLSIFINLSSQAYVIQPFFLFFFFLGIYKYKNYAKIKTNSSFPKRSRFIQPRKY